MISPLQKSIIAHIDSVADFPKAGILFKDISPIFTNPDLYRKIIADFADYSRGKIDVVCGIESRGFLFGISIANALNIPFVMLRKKGKLPPPLLSQSYDLEYGSCEIEMKKGIIQPHHRVLIHDDLLATGGTAQAAAILVEKQGARVAQFSFLIGLKDLNGTEKLRLHSSEIYETLQF